MRARVLAPSDLPRTRAKRVTLGGRVLVGEPGRLVLADAFQRVTVTGEGLVAEPGELVVVRGRLARGVLVESKLVERFQAPLPRGDGMLQRFCFEGTATRLAARARVLAEIRAFFAEEAFVEVQTPIRVRAPGVDAHVEAVKSAGRYLVTSPELALKRLLVGGLPRIFELARVLRADEQGPLHEPEFTLLEWYRAFAGFEAILADTERLLARVARRGRGGGARLLPP